jgi:hypothetical protein
MNDEEIFYDAEEEYCDPGAADAAVVGWMYLTCVGAALTLPHSNPPREAAAWCCLAGTGASYSLQRYMIRMIVSLLSAMHSSCSTPSAQRCAVDVQHPTHTSAQT